MRIASLSCAIVLSALCGLARGASTEITYQGQLRADSLPASGSYDLQFALFDAVTAGNQIGSTVASNAVTVTNGLFTVPLDFGKSFTGPDRWLEVSVAPAGGGSFTTLTPRQKLTAAPYALALPFLRTEASMNGPTFLSANVIAGSTANVVANGVTGTVIAGGGATNGFPQTINANYSSILGGYSNTIGVNGGQSTIGGGVANSVTAPSGTVAGGISNTVSATNGAICGGNGNTVGGNAGAVGGGVSNVANGTDATVPGGNANAASGIASFAAGTRAKALHAGSFVWGDSTNADVSSTTTDQMTIRAAGGVALTVDATNATTVPVGTLYRDNNIVAWGRVSSNALSDGFNIASFVRNSAGNYTVTLRTAVTGSALVPVVSVSYAAGAQPTTAAAMRIATTDQLLSTTTFGVFINSGTFAAADADFTFIVTGR